MASSKKEKVAACVQKHQCLYNKAFSDYKNRVKRDVAWTAVSDEMEEPGKRLFTFNRNFIVSAFIPFILRAIWRKKGG